MGRNESGKKYKPQRLRQLGRQRQGNTGSRRLVCGAESQRQGTAGGKAGSQQGSGAAKYRGQALATRAGSSAGVQAAECKLCSEQATQRGVGEDWEEQVALGSVRDRGEVNDAGMVTQTQRHNHSSSNTTTGGNEDRMISSLLCYNFMGEKKWAGV
ncbi:hypothetical protein AHAS_Ahas20G0217200 [Arachis hypogaea]